MQTIYIDNPDETMLSIANKLGYNGRKFKLTVSDHPINVKSYWSGGSRDYFHFVRLADKAIVNIPAQSAFDAQIPGADSVSLPDGVMCVQHSIFCGKDTGLTFIVKPANAAALLPAGDAEELTPDQMIVLCATRSLTSSYRLDEATRSTGISLREYDAAKNELIISGHLLKTGAITSKGKNAVGTVQLYQLRRQNVTN